MRLSLSTLALGASLLAGLPAGSSAAAPAAAPAVQPKDAGVPFDPVKDPTGPVAGLGGTPAERRDGPGQGDNQSGEGDDGPIPGVSAAGDVGDLDRRVIVGGGEGPLTDYHGPAVTLTPVPRAATTDDAGLGRRVIVGGNKPVLDPAPATTTLGL